MAKLHSAKIKSEAAQNIAIKAQPGTATYLTHCLEKFHLMC